LRRIGEREKEIDAPARLCASTEFEILLSVTQRRPLLSADQIPEFKVRILDPLDESQVSKIRVPNYGFLSMIF
jgi:hypothetical protein